MISRGSLPISQKLGYGLGAIAYAVPYQAMAGFFLFYVTAVLHIPPIIAGIIVAISVVWDAITDPLIGHISDRTQSARFGRRHLYLIIGGIGTALGSLLLWSISPEASDFYKISILLVLVLFTKTALTLYGAPYFAVGAAMSSDYDERSSIQSYRAAFHIIGMIIAIVGMTVIFFKSTPGYPRGQLNPDAYPAIGITIALITLTFSLLSAAMIPKDRKRLNQQALSQQNNIWQQSLHSLKNTNFKAIILMIFFIEVGFQISISIGFHVSTYTYNLSGPQIGILGLALLGASVISQPFWVYMSRQFEKKTALIIGMVFALIGFSGIPLTYVGFELFPLNQPQTLYVMIGFNVLAGIGNGAFMSLPFSMVADVTDQGEIHSGQRQEGLYFGLYTFAYKAGISISVLLGGFLLDAISFDSSLTQQTTSTTYNLAMVPTWLLLLFTPFIIWAISKYKITRDTHNKILSELKSRQ